MCVNECELCECESEQVVRVCVRECVCVCVIAIHPRASPGDEGLPGFLEAGGSHPLAFPIPAAAPQRGNKTLVSELGQAASEALLWQGRTARMQCRSDSCPALHLQGRTVPLLPCTHLHSGASGVSGCSSPSLTRALTPFPTLPTGHPPCARGLPATRDLVPSSKQGPTASPGNT